MPDEWYYARGNDRQGPIAREALLALLASGQVHRTDLAWSEGMEQWRTISHISELNVTPAAVAVEHAGQAPAPKSVAYYTPGLMPPRAQENLRGHAEPTGDVGTWPLNDARFEQFRETIKIRRPIALAAQLYRGLLFLALAIAICFGIAAAANVGRNRTVSLGFFIFTIVAAFLAGLYWMFSHFTLRSQRWAPMIFLALCVISAGIVILSYAAAVSARPPQQSYGWIGVLVTVVLDFVFGVISWRAFAAIPKFRAQPAWCQELIASAGL